MKKLYMCLLILLLVVMLGVGVYSFCDGDDLRSEQENRNLAALPEFTWSGLWDGSYLREMESYYSDQFPGREGILGANRMLNGFYYYSGDGEDSLLVLDYVSNAEHGGEALQLPQTETEPEPFVPDEFPPVVVKPEEESPVEQPEETPEPPVEQPEEEEPVEMTAVGTIIIRGDRAMEIPTATNEVIERYAAAVNSIHGALGDGVRTISLLTPNAGQFYSPEDLHTGLHDQKAMIDHCYDHMEEAVVTVDAYSALDAHQSEYIYFRTDHHWTALGAYYAYTALCQELGWEPVALEEFETGVYENFVGSLYKWTAEYPQSEALRNNPDTLTYYLPVVETHAKYYADATLAEGYPVSVVYRGLREEDANKYLCFLGGDHPACTVETAVEDGPVCLVLKESYGNALIPFLTSHYSKILVIDPREYNQEGKPDLDLVEFAKTHAVDDLIIVNYPFMINNAAYIKWMECLIEAS